MSEQKEPYVPGKVYTGEAFERRVREQSEAKTLDQLIALATQRSYPNPQKWAQHVFTARKAKAGFGVQN